MTDARTGLLANKAEREKFETLLNQALTDEASLGTLIARQKVAQPFYQSLEGERIPTVVSFANDISDIRTVIDVETEDHVGLLYAISQALSELGLAIYVAKITTEKGAAVDSFYVNERDGSKVVNLERQLQIERQLRAAITRLEAN